MSTPRNRDGACLVALFANREAAFYLLTPPGFGLKVGWSHDHRFRCKTDQALLHIFSINANGRSNIPRGAIDHDDFDFFADAQVVGFIPAQFLGDVAGGLVGHQIPVTKVALVAGTAKQEPITKPRFAAPPCPARRAAVPAGR